MHVSTLNHTIIHLPSYWKDPGILKIKFIVVTVVAEEKRMLISEEIKHISILWLSRCSETVCVVLSGSLQMLYNKVAHKKKIPFCEILDIENSIINLLLGFKFSFNLTVLGLGT